MINLIWTSFFGLWTLWNPGIYDTLSMPFLTAYSTNICIGFTVNGCWSRWKSVFPFRLPAAAWLPVMRDWSAEISWRPSSGDMNSNSALLKARCCRSSWQQSSRGFTAVCERAWRTTEYASQKRLHSLCSFSKTDEKRLLNDASDPDSYLIGMAGQSLDRFCDGVSMAAILAPFLASFLTPFVASPWSQYLRLIMAA